MPIKRKDVIMARYDRDFLVPYLEDICALHLSKQRLYGLIGSARAEIKKINETALKGVKPPVLEDYETDDAGLGSGCLGGVLCFLALVFLLMGCISGAIETIFLCVGILIVGIYFGIRGVSAKDRVNEEIKKRNDEKEADHALAEMAVLAAAQPKVDAVKKRIELYENEKNKVDRLLEQLYNVNVIPKWYRDLYPAVYLYDWFSNSRADDLDVALNTLVLEQIKDRLDTIIRNQSELIINQRIMIANQRQSIEQAERHHQMLTAKLDRIGASVEDQRMYLSMIEANTAANAYFAAANYLKR